MNRHCVEKYKDAELFRVYVQYSSISVHMTFEAMSSFDIVIFQWLTIVMTKPGYVQSKLLQPLSSSF